MHLIPPFLRKKHTSLNQSPKKCQGKLFPPQKKFSGPQLQEDVFQDAQASQHCSTKVLKQLTKAKENQAEKFPPKIQVAPKTSPPTFSKNLNLYPKNLKIDPAFSQKQN